MGRRKAKLTKHITERVFSDHSQWTVHYGQLKRRKGNPGTESLFLLVGEKLPYDALPDVKKHVLAKKYKPQGVYLAHDSMGCPRYIGRGSNVLSRLETRKKAQKLELQ